MANQERPRGLRRNFFITLLVGSCAASLGACSASAEQGEATASADGTNGDSTRALNATDAGSPGADGPKGIFALDGPGGTYRDGNIRSDDFVSGYTWRYSWKDIETSQGTYDFQPIDHIVAKVAAKGQKLSWIVLPWEPAYVLQGSTTWTTSEDGASVTKPLPWDSYMLGRYRKFYQAMADHLVADPTRGGAKVALKNHSAMYAINVLFPGLPNGGIRDAATSIVGIPGFTRQKFLDSTIEMLDLARDAFPNQHMHFGFWKIKDDADTGELWQALRDRVLADFDGVARKRIGFFEDNLAATCPSPGTPTTTSTPTTCTYTGAPHTTFAAPLHTSKSDTFITFQMLSSFASPINPDHVAKVKNGTPLDAIDYAYKTYGSRYVEIYAEDLKQTKWHDGLRRWSATLLGN